MDTLDGFAVTLPAPSPTARRVTCPGCPQTTWVSPGQPVPEGWVRADPFPGLPSTPVYWTHDCHAARYGR